MKFKILRLELLILLLILGLAAYLRFPGIIQGYVGFTFDQGRDLLAIRDLVEGTKFSLIGPTTGIPGIFYGPWWYWILAPFFFLFSGSPILIALTIAGFGLATIVLVYRVIFSLTKNVFFSLFGAFLASVSPHFIGTSSSIWSPNLLPFFLTLFLFFLIKIFEKRNWIYFLGLGLSYGFVLDMEPAFGTAFGVSTAFLVLAFRKFFLRRELFGMLAGFLFTLSPRIVFDIRHDFLISKSVINWLQSPAVFQEKLPILERILARLDLFLGLFSQSLTQGNKTLGLVLVVLVLTGLIFWYFNKKKDVSEKTKLFFYSQLLTLIVFLASFVIFPDVVWEHYFVGLPLLFMVSLVLLLWFYWKSGFPRILIISILSFLLIVNLFREFNSKIDWSGDASTLKNQIEILDHIQQDSGGQSFNLIIYTPPLIPYPYEYLEWWHWEKQGLPLPSTEDEDLVYLIIEPDYWQPWRLESWYKNYESLGKQISKKEFPGGVVVERREK